MDLLLNKDGEFEIGTWGEISNVAELEQIVQHITIALLTWRSELALHPTFGSNIYKLIGELNDSYLQPKAAIYVQEALAEIPHVSRVAAVEVYEDELDPNTYQMKVVVTVDMYGVEKNILIRIPSTS
jgi:phage baseplate assembly protein W